MKPAPEDAKAVPGAEGRFTTSFGLLDRLKRPEVKLDVVPILDLLVIALLMSLLFTRFVAVPGVRVELPSTDLRMRHTTSPVSVLTIGNRGMLFFDGSLYELSTIRDAFSRYIDAQEGAAAVLLIKAEAKMELQLFLDLCDMARQAGFAQIQITGKKAEESAPLIPGGGLEKRGDLLTPVL